MTEFLKYDVVIIGAGPAGLAAAIHIKQLNPDLSVCLLEKGAYVGAHIISGAVLEPASLQALLGDSWQNLPLTTPVTHDAFYYLTQKKAYPLPIPRLLNNHGNYLISLQNLCKFLSEEAEKLGCEIYSGFAAQKLLFNSKNQVIGVATGESGLDKSGNKKEHYQSAVAIYGRQHLFAEGCRGQLSQQVIQRFKLANHFTSQTYGLGLKELWTVPVKKHQLGHVIHTVGWPLSGKVYGGSFIYHLPNQMVALGLVVGLDYRNPYLDPFEELQQFKTHPFIKSLLMGGERIGYGARAVTEGGFQALPKLTFPGGLLIGDAAGFLNPAKIKGIHNAIKSGTLAAQTCVDALAKNPSTIEITDFNLQINQSSIARELYQMRNIRPGFRNGLLPGLFNAAFETYISRGKTPWTLKNNCDNQRLLPAKYAKPLFYPKPDNLITFDKLSSVYLTSVFHEANQPCHLTLLQPSLAVDYNYKIYAGPETRYCPANVYEYLKQVNRVSLQINAQNCIHCKTCDIKDPKQNIVWQAPEGGGGPNYINM